MFPPYSTSPQESHISSLSKHLFCTPLAPIPPSHFPVPKRTSWGTRFSLCYDPKPGNMWNATPSEEPEPNVTQDLDWDAFPANDSLTDELLPLFPAPLLAGVTATCVALFVVGISGNLLTMLVVSRFRELRTTTNLYLSSMAFSDLLIFLCMPLDLVRLWQYRPWNFGDLLCKLFQFVSESCTYATVLTITALSVERYFAICFPLRAKVVVTKGRVKLVILVIWAVAFCSAGPIFVLVGVEHENGTDPRDTNECRATEFAVRSGLLTVMVWVSSVFFFLPVFCLTVLYSLIGRKLWRRRGDAAVGASLRDQNHKQTVKMLGESWDQAAFLPPCLPFSRILYFCFLPQSPHVSPVSVSFYPSRLGSWYHHFPFPSSVSSCIFSYKKDFPRCQVFKINITRKTCVKVEIPHHVVFCF